MFVGFNAHITEQGVFSPYFKDFGQGLFDDQKSMVQAQLNSYVLDEGVLDVARIEEDWFPSIDADVFISHSHKDQELAIGLAGYTSFLESHLLSTPVFGDTLMNC